MKVVIFAGGLGTRLSEETSVRPKPMVEIAGKPIIWHIMKIYSHYGLNDFVVLGGYRVDYIKQYFLNYRMNSADFTIDLQSGAVTLERDAVEPWRVTVLDTGEATMTGGRLKRARAHIGEARFCLTYGDGVSDIDIGALIAHHEKSGAMATVTATPPAGRYGVLAISDADDRVSAFREKDSRDVGLINGGFFVCEPGVFDLIEGDHTVWEQEPMNEMVRRNALSAYRHGGFWQSMDTLRDKAVLEAAHAAGAPWLKGRA